MPKRIKNLVCLIDYLSNEFKVTNIFINLFFFQLFSSKRLSYKIIPYLCSLFLRLVVRRTMATLGPQASGTADSIIIYEKDFNHNIIFADGFSMYKGKTDRS